MFVKKACGDARIKNMWRYQNANFLCLVMIFLCGRGGQLNAMQMSLHRASVSAASMVLRATVMEIMVAMLLMVTLITMVAAMLLMQHRHSQLLLLQRYAPPACSS